MIWLRRSSSVMVRLEFDVGALVRGGGVLLPSPRAAGASRWSDRSVPRLRSGGVLSSIRRSPSLALRPTPAEAGNARNATNAADITDEGMHQPRMNAPSGYPANR